MAIMLTAKRPGAYTSFAVSLLVAAALCLQAPVSEAYAAPSSSESGASSSSSEASESAESVDAEAAQALATTLNRLDREVEEKTAARDALQAQSDDLGARIAVLQAELDEAYAKMPGVQQLAERSVSQRYKVQRQYPTLFETLLLADDLQSFIAGIEYVERAAKASVSQYSQLRKSVEVQEREKALLEDEKAGVDEELDRANEELKRVIEERDEAQHKADLVINAHLEPDGADWSAGEQAFVDEWAPRIDAFLQGSPMEGQGEAFARAAYRHHVDPRWSPAISTIESSNGRICIRPYNAWGWGAADSDPYGLALEWQSWEEAINAHVRGLATGYGYTITPIGAQTYCPPNWELWYSTTVNEMNRI